MELVGLIDLGSAFNPSTYSDTGIGDDLLREGRALSFALRLKKRKRGTNQTQTAKKAAISINVSSPAAYPLPFGAEADPYLYFGPFHFFCSCALWAKWKNQVK
jgi:hypothetical protein